MENKHSQMDFKSEIADLLRGSETPKAMLQRLENYHSSDICDVISELSEHDRQRFWRVATPDMLSEVLEYAEEDEAGLWLSEMDVRKAADVISLLDTDTAVDALRMLSRDKRGLILEAVDPEVRKELTLIASFDEEEIGSRMTTNCIVIREGMSVKEAMTELVEQAKENDNISTLFVTDEDQVFVGAIELKDLITARSSVPLAEITASSFPYLYASEQTADCLERLKDYSEDLVPVLDDANRLLGVITAQSVIEVVDEEFGEDYVRLAGLTAEEDLNEPLGQSMRKRLPWLLALLALGILVSTVVGSFEAVVAQLTIIMAFQSLILDMAGNVGTQSLAVTIRVLTDETLTVKQKLQLVAKETRVGLFNGLLLGLLSFVLIGLYIHLFKHKPLGFSFALSGCIGVSLIVSMIISSAVGTLIPLFFKRINVDPAVASGPLITTVNDLIAVVAYYGLSWLLLLNVMHLA